MLPPDNISLHLSYALPPSRTSKEFWPLVKLGIRQPRVWLHRSKYWLNLNWPFLNCQNKNRTMIKMQQLIQWQRWSKLSCRWGTGESLLQATCSSHSDISWIRTRQRRRLFLIQELFPPLIAKTDLWFMLRLQTIIKTSLLLRSAGCQFQLYCRSFRICKASLIISKKHPIAIVTGSMNLKLRTSCNAIR